MRLQICVIPATHAKRVAGASTIQASFLEIAPPNLTLDDLSTNICRRYSRLYPHKRLLEIHKLQDSEGNDLDLDFTVGEVFDDKSTNKDNSIVRVLQANASNVVREFSLPPESTLRPKSFRKRPHTPLSAGSIDEVASPDFRDRHVAKRTRLNEGLVDESVIGDSRRNTPYGRNSIFDEEEQNADDEEIVIQDSYEIGKLIPNHGSGSVLDDDEARERGDGLRSPSLGPGLESALLNEDIQVPSTSLEHEKDSSMVPQLSRQATVNGTPLKLNGTGTKTEIQSSPSQAIQATASLHLPAQPVDLNSNLTQHITEQSPCRETSASFTTQQVTDSLRDRTSLPTTNGKLPRPKHNFGGPINSRSKKQSRNHDIYDLAATESEAEEHSEPELPTIKRRDISNSTPAQAQRGSSDLSENSRAKMIHRLQSASTVTQRTPPHYKLYQEQLNRERFVQEEQERARREKGARAGKVVGNGEADSGNVPELPTQVQATDMAAAAALKRQEAHNKRLGSKASEDDREDDIEDDNEENGEEDGDEAETAKSCRREALLKKQEDEKKEKKRRAAEEAEQQKQKIVEEMKQKKKATVEERAQKKKVALEEKARFLAEKARQKEEAKRSKDEVEAQKLLETKKVQEEAAKRVDKDKANKLVRITKATVSPEAERIKPSATGKRSTTSPEAESPKVTAGKRKRIATSTSKSPPVGDFEKLTTPPVVERVGRVFSPTLHSAMKPPPHLAGLDVNGHQRKSVSFAPPAALTEPKPTPAPVLVVRNITPVVPPPIPEEFKGLAELELAAAASRKRAPRNRNVSTTVVPPPPGESTKPVAVAAAKVTLAKPTAKALAAKPTAKVTAPKTDMEPLPSSLKAPPSAQKPLPSSAASPMADAAISTPTPKAPVQGKVPKVDLTQMDDSSGSDKSTSSSESSSDEESDEDDAEVDAQKAPREATMAPESTPVVVEETAKIVHDSTELTESNSSMPPPVQPEVPFEVSAPSTTTSDTSDTNTSEASAGFPAENDVPMEDAAQAEDNTPADVPMLDVPDMEEDLELMKLPVARTRSVSKFATPVPAKGATKSATPVPIRAVTISASPVATRETEKPQPGRRTRSKLKSDSPASVSSATTSSASESLAVSLNGNAEETETDPRPSVPSPKMLRSRSRPSPAMRPAAARRAVDKAKPVTQASKYNLEPPLRPSLEVVVPIRKSSSGSPETAVPALKRLLRSGSPVGKVLKSLEYSGNNSRSILEIPSKLGRNSAEKDDGHSQQTDDQEKEVGMHPNYQSKVLANQLDSSNQPHSTGAHDLDSTSDATTSSDSNTSDDEERENPSTPQLPPPTSTTKPRRPSISLSQLTSESITQLSQPRRLTGAKLQNLTGSPRSGSPFASSQRTRTTSSSRFPTLSQISQSDVPEVREKHQAAAAVAARGKSPLKQTGDDSNDEEEEESSSDDDSSSDSDSDEEGGIPKEKRAAAAATAAKKTKGNWGAGVLSLLSFGGMKQR